MSSRRLPFVANNKIFAIDGHLSVILNPELLRVVPTSSDQTHQSECRVEHEIWNVERLNSHQRSNRVIGSIRIASPTRVDQYVDLPTISSTYARGNASGTTISFLCLCSILKSKPWSFKLQRASLPQRSRCSINHFRLAWSVIIVNDILSIYVLNFLRSRQSPSTPTR